MPLWNEKTIIKKYNLNYGIAAKRQLTGSRGAGILLYFYFLLSVFWAYKYRKETDYGR